MSTTDSTTDSKGRKIGYWVTTGLFAFAYTGSGVMSLIRPPELVEAYEHLGYPITLALLIGVAKLLAVVALLAPGFARLKEWAYAGITINLLGAVYVHLMAGDPVQQVIGPLIFLALAMTSWYLRPASRKLPDLSANSGRPELPASPGRPELRAG